MATAGSLLDRSTNVSSQGSHWLWILIMNILLHSSLTPNRNFCYRCSCLCLVKWWSFPRTTMAVRLCWRCYLCKFTELPQLLLSMKTYTHASLSLPPSSSTFHFTRTSTAPSSCIGSALSAKVPALLFSLTSTRSAQTIVRSELFSSLLQMTWLMLSRLL